MIKTKMCYNCDYYCEAQWACMKDLLGTSETFFCRDWTDGKELLGGSK